MNITRISKRKHFLAFGRSAWIILFLVIVAMWAAGIGVLARGPVSDCNLMPCDPSDLNAGDLETIRKMGFSRSADSFLLVVIGYNIPVGLLYFVFSAVIFWRKSDDWMGLLVSICLVFLGGILFTSTDDALVRGYPSLGFLREIIIPFGMILFVILFFVFPDGRIVPIWLWRPALLLVLAYILLELYGGEDIRLSPVWIVLLFPCMIFAQIYRYIRVSTPTERQQTKWAVVGLVGATALMVTWTLLGNFFPPDRPGPERIQALMIALPLLLLFSLLLPFSFAFSILRYRLWDIDFLIRRTLSYTILTALLGLLYFGSVIGLQNTFGDLTGQRSQVVVVISTLAIAALFNPLRTRVQGFIDRSFYRQKYNMAQTVEAFATAVRDEVDVDRLNVALLKVVADTMQPEGASLWIREGRDQPGIPRG